MREKVVCANCGIEIRWQPTIVEGKVYCCPGCTEGGPCDCDYDNLPEPGAMNPLVIQTAETRRRPGQLTASVRDRSA